MLPAITRIIVGHDPVEALVIARQLAREGHDTSELHEAAIAALTSKPQQKDAPDHGNTA